LPVFIFAGGSFLGACGELSIFFFLSLSPSLSGSLLSENFVLGVEEIRC
jgi:hypothetical protein